MKVKKGLDLPINGSPSNDIDGSKTVTQVAITGPDYHGMKPTMNVEVGDKVKLGQVVFVDKKQPGVKYTSPASGEVIAVNRGDKRVFQTLVIKVSGNDEVTFNSHSEDQILGLSEENVRSQLIESGLWTTIRTRPFSRTPAIDSKPAGIFVSTIDTRPLAANPGLIIDLHAKEFKTGLEVLSKLTDGKVYLNKAINQIIPGAESHFVETNTWEGPHPAGLVGTHIHNLLPASISRVVWTVGYQDVIAIGSLFLTGKIFTDRYVALGGPAAKNPRILKTKLGACLDELLKGEEKETEYEARTISGSVLDGRTASGNLCFLSQWSNQVTLIEEGHKREFFIVDGWLSHGINKYSCV